MNKKELMLKRRKTWYKYKIPGMSNLYRIKMNCIFISPAASKRHEMAKCDLCYDLQARGEKYITEAATCSGNRRVDVVSLDTGQEYEIETDKNRAARFKGMEVEVIMV